MSTDFACMHKLPINEKKIENVSCITIPELVLCQKILASKSMCTIVDMKNGP